MGLELIIYPNDILRTKCQDLTEPPSDELINDMFHLMKNRNGIGLAAPQIGLSQNLFIIGTATDNIVFVNPKIVSYSKEYCLFTEGCLSIPGERIEISRPQIIEIEYLDEFMNKKKEIFSGINGRVIQHEADHLQGILILDYYSE